MQDDAPMDGPSIVAGISVLVAGATSLGAPVIAGRNQRRGDKARIAFELHRSEREELRTLLDEAAEVAFELAHAAEQLDFALTQGVTNPEELREHVLQRRKTLGYLHARMHVRIGRAPVAERLDEFINAVSVATQIDRFHTTTESPDETPRGQADRTLTDRMLSYWSAYWEYVAAAQALVGMTTVEASNNWAQGPPSVPESPGIA